MHMPPADRPPEQRAAPPPAPPGDAVMWGPVAATVLTALIVALAWFLGLLLVSALAGLAALLPAPPDRSAIADAAVAEVGLLGWQIGAAALVLIAAARPGWGALRYLGLDRRPHRREVVLAIGGLVALALPYNAVVMIVAREAAMADLRPFAEGLGGPVPWLLAVIVCLGAPLAEELLFRGFLLPALARSRLGFPVGALLATAGWAALHTGYSIWGLLEIFLIGLYLSWVFKQTRNLWVPIACHAAYNSLLTGLLAAGVLTP